MKQARPRSTCVVVLLTAAALLALGACSTPTAADDEAPSEARDDDEGGHDDERHHDHAHHDDDEHHDDHSGHHEHSFDDPERYAERWNDPARDEWQKPLEILAAMEIEEGMTVADIGAGTGYFIPFLSQAVGSEGTVYAVDIEPSMLAYIDQMAEDQGLANVETIEAGDDSGLPAGEVDRIMTVNTWHHIPNRGEYSRHLRERLSTGGSVWVVDYHKDSPSGPPPEHRLPPQVVVDELEEGGFDAEVYEIDLERQYVVVARPATP